MGVRGEGKEKMCVGGGKGGRQKRFKVFFWKGREGDEKGERVCVDEVRRK